MGKMRARSHLSQSCSTADLVVTALVPTTKLPKLGKSREHLGTDDLKRHDLSLINSSLGPRVWMPGAMRTAQRGAAFFLLIDAVACFMCSPAIRVGTGAVHRSSVGAPASKLSRYPLQGLSSMKCKLEDRFWDWKGYNIRYQSAGEDNAGPSLVLVHGFGGNADHWRKNTAELASNGFRVFAIDLIGYGYSDKPDPQSMQAVNGELTRDLESYKRFAKEGGTAYGKVGDTHFTDMAHPLGSGYNFYTWADQLVDFSKDVVKSNDGIFAVCNSIGSCAGLQMAIDAPDMVNGVVICDPSLRMLNVKRQNPLGVPLISAFQTLLRETPVGEAFFGVVATENTVKNVLKQCYGDQAAVTDELVQAILNPGKTENAPRVFLDFISYSAGPLPEEQLEILSSSDYLTPAGAPKIPVSILWGDKDPWEPVSEGRAYEKFGCVDEFKVLNGAGHCPQDEAPQLVNPLVVDFVQRYAGVGAMSK